MLNFGVKFCWPTDKKNPRDLHLKEELRCCQVLSFPTELGYFHTVAAVFFKELKRNLPLGGAFPKRIVR